MDDVAGGAMLAVGAEDATLAGDVEVAGAFLQPLAKFVTAVAITVDSARARNEITFSDYTPAI